MGMSKGKAMGLILKALDEAEEKHPEWHGSKDIIHGVGILCEEAGESMQAALDIVYAEGTHTHLIKELSQAGAMAIRNLIHLQGE